MEHKLRKAGRLKTSAVFARLPDVALLESLTVGADLLFAGVLRAWEGFEFAFEALRDDVEEGSAFCFSLSPVFLSCVSFSRFVRASAS